MLSAVTSVIIIVGLLSLIVMLSYLTLKWPNRNRRGNWRLRVIGVSAGIAIVGAGVFLLKGVADPTDIEGTVGTYVVGIGIMTAFFSAVVTTRHESNTAS